MISGTSEEDVFKTRIQWYTDDGPVALVFDVCMAPSAVMKETVECGTIDKGVK